MENRLKERLTGAAILVALIVMLVPEIFRGQGGDTPHGSSSGGDGPPVRTYTIDLSSNPKSTAPIQAAAEAQSNAPVAPAPAAATSPPASTAPPPSAAARVARSPPATPTPTPTPPGAAPAAAPPAAAKPVAAKAATGGAWSVQLGLFSKRENAERMMNEAKAKGFNAAVSSPDAKGQFHVHVTGLTDRGAAQAMVQKLKDDGLPAAVVAP
jgi:DedD protein